MRIIALAVVLCSALVLSGCAVHHHHDRHPGHRYEKPVHHKKGWDKPKPPHHKVEKQKKDRPPHERHPDRKHR